MFQNVEGGVSCRAGLCGRRGGIALGVVFFVFVVFAFGRSRFGRFFRFLFGGFCGFGVAEFFVERIKVEIKIVIRIFVKFKQRMVKCRGNGRFFFFGGGFGRCCGLGRSAQYAGTNRIAVVGNRSAGSARADFLIGFFLLDDGDACGFGNNLDRFIEKAAKGAHGKKNDV